MSEAERVQMKSPGESSMVMDVLNVCVRCGDRKVKDVKEELELLLQSKVNAAPGQCGICLKVLPQSDDGNTLEEEEAAEHLKKKDIPTFADAATNTEIRTWVETVDVPFDAIVPAEKKTMFSGITALNAKNRNKRKRVRPLKKVKYPEDDDDNDDSADVFFDSDLGEAPSLSDSDDMTVIKKGKVKKKNKPKKVRVKREPKVKVKREAKSPTVRKSPKLTKPDYATLPDISERELKIRRALDPRLLALVDTESRPTKALICKACKFKKEGFIGVQKFIAHVNNHLDEKLEIPKPYLCPFCSSRVLNFTIMERHMATHTHEKVYPCSWESCSASFTCQRYLRKHIRQKHEGRRYKVNQEKKYQCHLCEFKTARNNSLTRHINGRHANCRLYKCRFCDKRFNDPSNQSAHERCVHGGKKEYICETCGYAAHFKCDLAKHQLIHTGEKPYTCDRCGYRCNRRSNLTTHLKIHTGEKSFKCHACDMTFKSIKSCKNHEKSHTQPKPMIPSAVPHSHHESGSEAKHTMHVREQMHEPKPIPLTITEAVAHTHHESDHETKNTMHVREQMHEPRSIPLTITQAVTQAVAHTHHEIGHETKHSMHVRELHAITSQATVDRLQGIHHLPPPDQAYHHTIPPVAVNPMQASGSTHHPAQTSSEEWVRAVELLHNLHPV